MLYKEIKKIKFTDFINVEITDHNLAKLIDYNKLVNFKADQASNVYSNNNNTIMILNYFDNSKCTRKTFIKTSIKIRHIPLIRVHKMWNDEDQYYTVFIKAENHIDLGNNYNMNHYCNALFNDLENNEKLIDLIELNYSIEDDIKIQCVGNYGLVTLNTCGSDLADYFKSLNDQYYNNRVSL